MKQKEINKVEIRNLQKEDYDQLASSFTRVYADGSDVFWTPEQIDKLIRILPTIMTHQQETSSNFTTSVGAKSIYSMI